MNVSVSVKGNAEFQKALREIADKCGGDDLSDSVRYAAEPMVDAIRRNARIIGDSGALANAIDVKEVEYQSGNMAVVIIGPNVDYTQMVVRKTTMPDGTTFTKTEKARPSNYAHLVEFGTGAHRLSERANASMHPGTKEMPFMRPGFDTSVNAVVHRFEKRYGNQITKRARRAAGRFGSGR